MKKRAHKIKKICPVSQQSSNPKSERTPFPPAEKEKLEKTEETSAANKRSQRQCIHRNSSKTWLLADMASEDDRGSQPAFRYSELQELTVETPLTGLDRGGRDGGDEDDPFEVIGGDGGLGGPVRTGLGSAATARTGLARGRRTSNRPGGGGEAWAGNLQRRGSTPPQHTSCDTASIAGILERERERDREGALLMVVAVAAVERAKRVEVLVVLQVRGLFVCL